MKKSKIQLQLFFVLLVIYSFHLTAQQNMSTLFENFHPVEDDISEITSGKDQAWAGVETTDGGLLVVGAIEYGNEKKGFIRRYNFPNLSTDPNDANSYLGYTIHTQLINDWREINDIIAIGNDQYIIVGQSTGGWLTKPGIGVFTDNGANTDVSINNYDVWEKVFIPEKAKRASAYGVIADDQEPVYTVVLYYQPSGKPKPWNNHTIYLFRFRFENDEFNFPQVSQEYEGLRIPQNLALCGDHILVAGQGLNNGYEGNDDGLPDDLTLPLIITSWSKDNLTLVSSYIGNLDNHKPKMVACAGPQGVIACGGFDYPEDGGTTTLFKSLAYFPDLSDLGGNDPVNGVDPTFEYFNDEIQQIVDLHPMDLWTTNESYCEAVADRSTGGWIFAGQVGANEAENMAAIIIKNDGSDTEFTLTAYTDVFHGNSTGTDVDLANYVIQLSGQPNRYALFGKADWSGDVGNTYVVIVSETK